MFRSGIVLPLPHSRRRVAARRVFARQRRPPIRVLLLALGILLAGGADILVCANAMCDDLSVDGRSSSVLGFELLTTNYECWPSAIAPLRVSSSPMGATLRNLSTLVRPVGGRITVWTEPPRVC